MQNVSGDLLNYVKERTLDRNFQVRKEALTGLAKIYKELQYSAGRRCDISQQIANKILHGYYMTGLQDRLLVERLLNTCLVPFQLAADIRMKRLFLLYATIDENATKSFNEMQKIRATVRQVVVELTDILSCNGRHGEIPSRLAQLSKFLPDPIKATEFIGQWTTDLIRDGHMLRLLETIVHPQTSCRQCADVVKQLLKRLGEPVETNLYFYTIKLLMDRISSVLIDQEAVEYLASYPLP